MSDQKHKFRAGNIVQLRSGGPAMTVDSEGKSEVRCFWFASTELRNGTFSPASLLSLEPEKEAKTDTVSDSTNIS
jgi:uncharacterized protein YodC (DUF2158 family)